MFAPANDTVFVAAERRGLAIGPSSRQSAYMSHVHHPLFSALLVTFASAAACVAADAPGVPTETTPDSSNVADSASIADGSPDGGGAEAGPVTCKPGETACGVTCVDLQRSPTNCGSCGRSCGGGKCDNGVCAIAVVRANIDRLGGFDVEADKLYFTSFTKVNACSADNCQTAPAQLIDLVTYDAYDVEVDLGFVHFNGAPNSNTERRNLMRCPVAGCANPPVSLLNGGLVGLGQIAAAGGMVFGASGNGPLTGFDCKNSVCTAGKPLTTARVARYTSDGTTLYFGDSTSSPAKLKSCALADAPCAAPAEVAPEVRGQIVVAQGLVYFVGPGATSGGDGLWACRKADCANKPAAVLKLLSPIENLAADEQGIFWTSEKTIYTCPNFACTGGPKALANDLSNVKYLRVESKYVYFSVDGATPKSSSIQRLAR
jgi:hypothetical protein